MDLLLFEVRAGAKARFDVNPRIARAPSPYGESSIRVYRQDRPLVPVATRQDFDEPWHRHRPNPLPPNSFPSGRAPCGSDQICTDDTTSARNKKSRHGSVESLDATGLGLGLPAFSLPKCTIDTTVQNDVKQASGGHGADKLREAADRPPRAVVQLLSGHWQRIGSWRRDRYRGRFRHCPQRACLLR